MFIPLEFKLFGSRTNGVIKGFQMTMELYESLGQRQAENRQTQLRWVNTMVRSYIWVNGAEVGDYMCIV